MRRIAVLLILFTCPSAITVISVILLSGWLDLPIFKTFVFVWGTIFALYFVGVGVGLLFLVQRWVRSWDFWKPLGRYPSDIDDVR